ncbi:MAG: S-methyl-5'-thioinosine phosphorylase [Gammaproteobacteria bacterium]
MSKLAIIGGSGLTSLSGLEISGQQEQQTPWGEPSGPLIFGEYAGIEIVFLPRHGNPHVIPPHKVNYCANIWALKENNVTNIVSVNAVGGITKEMSPGRLVVPDQIIDYTWSRGHTFFGDNLEEVVHVDFTSPYCEELRQHLIAAGNESNGIELCSAGTYGATQGPRLESAAEIDRMERDGCDIVGMTGMPEAALARELGINFVSCSLVVNWAAGKSSEPITMKVIEDNLKKGIGDVRKLLANVIPEIAT